jgi:TetR/AcrR family transcriptional regulator
MNTRFEKIAETDQKRILQAAMQEFAGQGYRHASTNSIVKAACIPKGTLFYFFGSKKELFFYLLDGAIKDYIDFVHAEKGELPVDLFDRLLYREQVKLRFAAAQPLIFRFFSRVFLDIPEEIRTQMTSRFKDYSAASAEDLEVGLDQYLFREGVDVKMAIRMIHVLLEGVFSRYTPQLRRADPNQLQKLIEEISDECRQYFELIRKGIYR